MYHRNIFGSSSKVFRNFRKFSGTFVWPSEQFWKIFRRWSEIFGKSSKTPLRSLVRYCSCHSNVKFISSRHRVISSMSITGQTLKKPGANSFFYNNKWSNWSLSLVHASLSCVSVCLLTMKMCQCADENFCSYFKKAIL